jgi:hypothetical protein
MVGLGILNDHPLNSIQPPLANGIHLRFAFARERGFPWHGYYIFRRPHQQSKPLCISSEFKPEWKPGPWPDARASFAPGEFYSDVNLAFADQFPPSGRSEFDLRGRRFLRFKLSPPEAAREFQVRIGLLKEGGDSPPPQKSCVEFTAFKPVLLSNPFVSDEVEFTSRGPGAISRNAQVEKLGNLVGLLCDPQLTVKLPKVATAVELDLSYAAQPATVAVLDPNGRIVGEQKMSVKAGVVETLTFSGQQILSLTINSPVGKTLLHRICYSVPAPIEQKPVGPIKLTAFHESVPVAQAMVSGRAGDVVTALLSADIMTAIEIDGGPAVLIDICYVSVSQDLAAGWATLRGLQYPLCLPTKHSDYPCPGKPTTAAQAQSMALARIHYGNPANWGGQNFASLSSVLDNLVINGPPPTGLPMADRSQAYASSSPDTPGMPRQHPLDLLLLGSLHPSVAMMLGLYCVDSSAQPGVAYDYIVIADHSGRFNGNPAAALAALSAPLPNDVDVWVTYNKKLAPAPPLPPPAEVSAYALPGSFVGNSGHAPPPPAGSNAAGVRWRIDAALDGKLMPGAPIGYHLWRADLGGNQPTTAPPQSSYLHLTTKGMVIVANATLPSGSTPENASDWPPFRLFGYDRGLADGWYSYGVSAVDIFGRHSAMSPPSAWFQWTPAPAPKPWYYVDPPADMQINAFAVQLLDKTPPPRPPGVEATALDPDDPMLLKDDAYDTWWSGTPSAWWNSPNKAARDQKLGLRVRWRWSEAQILQAPDTREFRIYFNPGTELPSDYSAPTNWQDRIYIVGYDEHFTDLDGNSQPLKDEDGVAYRQYDVLLPIMSGPPFAGVPLAPTNANPVVYAHVGVSAADDKIHTADDPKWASGSWGGRNGNEGRVGAPAKIYRVLRAPPPPPGTVDDSDNVFATRADYHSRSYVTVHWPKAAHMKGHVFRALDDTLFQIDLAQRPRGPLNTSDPVLFPITSWNQATKDAISAEHLALDALDTDLSSPGATAAARVAYGALSNNALRVLAGLPSNEAAFSRITYAPLDPDDTANADRAGPDGQDGYAPDSALCAYLVDLDGRAQNRYFFRVAYVNGAHTIGALGPSSPPVYLPKVEPPRTPVITKILGGDRQITITFASNREADLAEYRIYRADSARNARDIRLMALAHTEIVPSGPPTSRPPEVVWTDTLLLGSVTYYYRLASADSSGNLSVPTPALSGTTYDDSRPAPPSWNTPAAGENPGETQLSWTSPDPNLSCMVKRSPAGLGQWQNASGWLARGTYIYTDATRTPSVTYDYRLLVLDSRGRQNNSFNVQTI